MANICSNALTVRGTEKAVRKFMEEVRGEDRRLDFGRIIPVADDVSSEDRACIWWGCSWNAEDVSVSIRFDTQTKEFCADYQFITSWNAPYLVYPEMSAKYPDLIITAAASESDCDYYFEGSNVSGHWCSSVMSNQEMVTSRKAMTEAWLRELCSDPKGIDWRGLLKDDRVYYSLDSLSSEGPQVLTVKVWDEAKDSVDRIIAEHRILDKAR